jgi:hypothetical protein
MTRVSSNSIQQSTIESIARAQEKIASLQFQLATGNKATTESDLGRAFATMHNSLTNNGLAIFDFWHRAAWDNDPPVTRMTSRKNSTVEVKRVSSPVLDHLTGLVSIDMDLFVHDFGMDEETYIHFAEHHDMRSYTLQELSLAAKLAGLDVVGCGPWMTTSRQLISSDWYGWIALQKSSRS